MPSAKLSKYRKMRDFGRTAEPRGASTPKPGSSYVIQKHEARRLHYDFRLELDGVLLSWAVPKGPSLDPSVKRLAQQTEDHPVEYGGFEGTIPQGEYGGGTVMLWDRGTWAPEGDARAAYRKGRLTFTLHGERLRGRWHLVRTGGRDSRSWLLFKSHDEASTEDGDSLVEQATTSVATRRTMDEIAAGARAKATSAKATSAKATSAKATSAKAADGNRGKRAPVPAALEVELATLVESVPDGDAWLHEIKLDGYRLLARVHAGDVTLISRNGKDWTKHALGVAAAVGELGVDETVFDGELVALREDGISDFQRLQNAMSEGSKTPLIYCAFDLLYHEGEDLRELPLEARKERLRAVLGVKPKRRKAGGLPPLAGDGAIVRYSEHIGGNGASFFEAACRLGLEGVISKRRDAPYRGGRGRDWVKTKCGAEQEFVIGGFTEPSGSRAHLGALLVGLHRDGELHYSGKVGTGYTQRSLSDLHRRLAPLVRKTAPFVDPPRGADARGVHYVEPELVAVVAFTEMTQGGRLRHPTFRGLRDDKPATSVRPERAQRAPAVAGEPAEPRARAKGKTAGKSVPAKPSGFDAIVLSNPGRILYPEQGTTKRDLLEYYRLVSELMLPHVVDRPLTLVRCPAGRGSSCFFQKHVAKGRPESLRVVPIRESEGVEDYLALDDERGLADLVQLGVLEIHTWGSRAADLEHPDILVFDLDPDPDLPWARVVEAAELLHASFERLDLETFVKTTGGKGLHVCVPVRPALDWDLIKAFCKSVAEALVSFAPDRYVATVTKSQRRGKIFVDYLRNGRGATFIAPYSTRARPGAPVAMPVTWKELGDIRGDTFTVATAPERLRTMRTDPFAGLLATRQSLTRARLRSLPSALKAG